ncbi:5-formyltetrahydrofolate cyclo-ligase [Sphingobium sufflavum]|uniref:5-formyltetrahydrofolate cyclo-ligase n=1 Tax=Sphingobium sufflavum TaxID=1129547 RepID=UPI001F39C1B8|nr:5-formyltetrahydrofolate cyclo-ligase [Sphingobium sufflavum]MCE7796980.1 5-formyltetrahydrofolate cyclo-ligase [Sphingobium sufflavum]
MTPVDDQTPTRDEQAAAKAALRTTLRDRRARYVAALPPSVRGIAFRVLPSPLIRRLTPGSIISLYHATRDEAPTANIAAQLDELGFRLALPRIDRETGAMAFARWDLERILVPGPFRTLQPGAEAAEVTPDVIIAPLVGFDGALNRLGQGGGYFDRAFAAHPQALRIGLGWSAQQVDHVPVDAHDRPLDIVVTETAILEKEEAAQ